MDIAEVYSPPRVAEMADRTGLVEGWSLDLTTCDEHGEPWDFSKAKMREKAWRPLQEQQPRLLIGSLLCTLFSTWQRLNKPRFMERYKQQLRQARVHLNFCCKLYLEQIRLLLREHPQGASSWSEPEVLKLQAKSEVTTIVTDQCQLGQRDKNGGPIKKPTRWMSNSAHILGALDVRCSGKGGGCSSTNAFHAQCTGQTA